MELGNLEKEIIISENFKGDGVMDCDDESLEN